MRPRPLPNRVEERRGGVAGDGETMRQPRQLLLVKSEYALVQAPNRLRRNRVKELWRGVASLGEGPRRAGHVLRVEVGDARQCRQLELLPQGVPGSARDGELCDRVRRVGHVARGECPRPEPRLLS